MSAIVANKNDIVITYAVAIVLAGKRLSIPTAKFSTFVRNLSIHPFSYDSIFSVIYINFSYLKIYF